MADNQSLTLGEADAGRTVTLKIGRQFDIQLLENRTTGFRWQLLKAGDPVCALLDQAFKPGGKMPGQPGVHIWSFRIAAEGTATIELAYRRSWEPPSPQNQVFAVSVSGQQE